MTLVTSPLVVSIRLLRQSRFLFTTVASLASAKPKWKITESTNAKSFPSYSRETTKTGREDARYQYSRAAFKDQHQLGVG